MCGGGGREEYPPGSGPACSPFPGTRVVWGAAPQWLDSRFGLAETPALTLQAAALLLEASWLPPFSWARDAFPVVLSELCFCAGLGPDLKRWERSGSVISDPH